MISLSHLSYRSYYIQPYGYDNLEGESQVRYVRQFLKLIDWWHLGSILVTTQFSPLRLSDQSQIFLIRYTILGFSALTIDIRLKEKPR
jgi:hypothetical protein